MALITVRDAAKRLGVTKHAIRWNIAKGHLNAVKFGKRQWAIDEADFLTFKLRRELKREGREETVEETVDGASE